MKIIRHGIAKLTLKINNQHYRISLIQNDDQAKLYRVRKLGSNNIYRTGVNNIGETCNCGDIRYRSTVCKHIQALKVFGMI